MHIILATLDHPFYALYPPILLSREFLFSSLFQSEMINFGFNHVHVLRGEPGADASLDCLSQLVRAVLAWPSMRVICLLSDGLSMAENVLRFAS